MNRRPLTIEFTGLPNSGKTTLINDLYNLLKRNNISVKVMQEDAELVPKEIPKKTWIRNTWITFGQLQSLLEIPYAKEDVILLDRGYYDALFWAKFLYSQSLCSKEQSDSLLRILHEMNDNFNLLPDYLFVIDVSIEKSLERRYSSGGEPPVITNKDFLSFYKNELDSFYKGITSPMWYLDTSDLSVKEVRDLVFSELSKFIV